MRKKSVFIIFTLTLSDSVIASDWQLDKENNYLTSRSSFYSCTQVPNQTTSSLCFDPIIWKIHQHQVDVISKLSQPEDSVIYDRAIDSAILSMSEPLLYTLSCNSPQITALKNFSYTRSLSGKTNLTLSFNCEAYEGFLSQNTHFIKDLKGKGINSKYINEFWEAISGQEGEFLTTLVNYQLIPLTLREKVLKDLQSPEFLKRYF